MRRWEAFASDFVKLNELTQEKIKVEDELEHKMERWEYLEELNARIKGSGQVGDKAMEKEKKQ